MSKLTNKVVCFLFSESIIFNMKEDKKDNIVKFCKYKNELTDSDISNLFAGFVSLLKKKALIDCEKKYHGQILVLKNKIRDLEKKLEEKVWKTQTDK